MLSSKVDACKPLHSGQAGAVWYHVNPGVAVGDSPLPWRFVGRFLGLCVTSGHGLTLVHSSAQPEPFLTQHAPLASP